MLRIQSLLSAVLPLALCATAMAQQSPDESLRALLQGNRRFAEDRSVAQPVGPGIRHTLARGQSPYAVIVTCADSRVPPEHLFNTGLGELIVVRTAGHVIGSEAIATIEDAVSRLNVPLCIVLGHEHCDVISAALQQSGERSHEGHLSPAVTHLLERIEPAIRKAQALGRADKQLQDVTEEEHAQATVLECMSRSPLLRRFSSVGKFRMVAARYHLSGDVEVLPNRPLPAKPAINRPILAGTVPPSLPPHVALRMLRSGHRRFLGDSRPAPDLTKARREVLAEGQQPLAIVLTDSDSRVSPEHIFDAGIGELYVIRVAGNTMTDEALASIEFAASQLGASLLVVMGHSRCESIAAATEHPEKQQMTPHQRKLLRQLEPSVTAARAGHDVSDIVSDAAKANVTRAIHEARSRSALLRVLEDRGQFSMLGTYYDVAKGDITWLKVAPAKQPMAQHEPAHGDDSHGDDSHGDETNSADNHASNSHGSGAHHPGSHGATDPLPPAPAGEMAADQRHSTDTPASSHDAPHDADSGDTHGASHDDDAGHAARGGHGGHDVDSAHGHGTNHQQAHPEPGHGAPSGHDHSHGISTDDVTKHLKDPVFLIGISGIVSLLAAAMLALRRKS
jgi:carbonic anhydrase